MAFLPRERQGCNQSSGIYFFRSDDFREIRLLLTNRNRENRKGNARRLAGPMKKKISMVIGFYLHVCRR